MRTENATEIMNRNKSEKSEGLFVWAVAGWLCRESCCAGKAAVQRKLLFQV
jgi:hypothetical protein